MFGQLYHLLGATARKTSRRTAGSFDLVDAARRIVKTYSGGMRRRLDLAASLIMSPPVLFLDEPTTGLDPRSRIAMWEVISNLVTDGTTVLLTTQYLEEADQLANQIVVIDHGRVIAIGTADELKTQIGGERIETHCRARQTIWPRACRPCAPSRRARSRSTRSAARSSCRSTKARNSWLRSYANSTTRRFLLEDLALRRPTLDDVFLTLTGRAADEEEC